MGLKSPGVPCGENEPQQQGTDHEPIPNKLVVMRIITATIMPMARKMVLRRLMVFIT
jgi:hypothetical protein